MCSYTELLQKCCEWRIVQEYSNVAALATQLKKLFQDIHMLMSRLTFFFPCFFYSHLEGKGNAEKYLTHVSFSLLLTHLIIRLTEHLANNYTICGATFPVFTTGLANSSIPARRRKVNFLPASIVLRALTRRCKLSLIKPH